jgi:hypothetical protein
MSDYNLEPVGLKHIDHMVGNGGWNEMNIWVNGTRMLWVLLTPSLMTNNIPNILLNEQGDE